MKPLILTCAALGLLAAPLAAASYKNSTYQAETQSRAVSLQPRDGTGPARQARQVYVTVTRLDGAGMSNVDVSAAGGFARQVGCPGGQALSTIASGRAAGSADFEILCIGG
ncbi:hypothetical protein PGB28_09685 [Primorskyibacter aestuariivivens]|uniref:hypothetical protein n=1 Tax=Primorskyibacter aestuariivivens TaxID=1888912 RepID=UPI002301B815|nr:hypothetical protein [Primorskyibacter aestuariivivens]MDA7428730.1 hypothetical protein [Primorskyibacter aestuariivivens]